MSYVKKGPTAFGKWGTLFFLGLCLKTCRIVSFVDDNLDALLNLQDEKTIFHTYHTRIFDFQRDREHANVFEHRLCF